MSKKRRIIIDYSCDNNDCKLELCKSLFALKGALAWERSGILSLIETIKVLLSNEECNSEFNVTIEHM